MVRDLSISLRSCCVSKSITLRFTWRWRQMPKRWRNLDSSWGHLSFLLHCAFFIKTKIREINQFVCIKEICTNPDSRFLLLCKAWHPTHPQSQALRSVWDRKSNYIFRQNHAGIPLELWGFQPCPQVSQPAWLNAPQQRLREEPNMRFLLVLREQCWLSKLWNFWQGGLPTPKSSTL